MLIPPSAKGVGWHHTADSGFEPVGARERREPRRSRGNSQSMELNNTNEAQLKGEEDAALALMAVHASQVS